ncbi:MAG: hydroxyethylthiazole kinase [Clostridiaceae bacterium BRH_c20a]|nr:MAG: hydroxyethylthiazole kinase [Clostridiaceae bacterium BRH_c20a]
MKSTLDFKLLDDIRQIKPLVHHITNNVTINDCANITLCLGALPVMANSIDEVEEIVENADSLVLNMGTLSNEQYNAILLAGEKANQKNIPIVLDPVGVGATTSRTKKILELLEIIKPTVIKGNAAEISILSGQYGVLKGIESQGIYNNIIPSAEKLANSYNCIVAVTGQNDIITNGQRTFIIENGHWLMGKIIGTGCMAASVIGCFMATGIKTLEACTCALSAYGISAELASIRDDVRGPGSFKSALMDEAYNLQVETINQLARIRKV